MLLAMDFFKALSEKLLNIFDNVPKDTISRAFQEGRSVPGYLTDSNFYALNSSKEQSPYFLVEVI